MEVFIELYYLDQKRQSTNMYHDPQISHYQLYTIISHVEWYLGICGYISSCETVFGLLCVNL